MTRSTYTYTLLDVTPATFAEIAGKLRRAGYHSMLDAGHIDMHGIGLCAERGDSGMEVIELKQDPVPFQETWDGDKTFEVRTNDRPFAVGRVLRLRETAYSGESMREKGMPLTYTGREVYALITHMHGAGEYNVDSRLCIMSTRVLDLIDVMKDHTLWDSLPPTPETNPTPD